MIEKLRQWILKWLGVAHILELRIGLLNNDFQAQRGFDNATRDLNLADEAAQRHRVEFESLSRDQSALDQIRLNHETLLSNVKTIVESHVEEHITKLQSSQHRFVSCPACGKSYNLAASGAAYNTRAITIACDNCRTQFEIRPSLFWNKIEVEKR